MKNLIVIFLSMAGLGSNAAKASCEFSTAVSSFKSDLEKSFFNGNKITMRFAPKNLGAVYPKATTGDYLFVADGKWIGDVRVDLNACKATSGKWVMWNTIGENGDYL